MRRFTLVEILTALVALVVIVAVAIPLWRTQELRAHRRAAADALLAIQAAQDRYFGEHAHYGEAADLALATRAPGYTFEVMRHPDGLGYRATARALAGPGPATDARCAELGIDQHGRRFAASQSGEDTTADCWQALLLR